MSNNKKLTSLPNIHPGEVLLEEFLKPMEITQYRLAKNTGIPHSRITGIIQGKRSITADTAKRFAQFFGTTDKFWMNLQTAYDLEETERASGKQIRQEVTPHKAA